MKFSSICIFLVLSVSLFGQYDNKLALIKYNGGGDWYANPTALPNLSLYCNETLGTKLNPDYATVEVGSAELFNYPFLHLTGHGNVVFSESEAYNLRMYLLSGGFLHIDDNYGLDPFIRIAMKTVFPELDFIEIPYDHPEPVVRLVCIHRFHLILFIIPPYFEENCLLLVITWRLFSGFSV